MYAGCWGTLPECDYSLTPIRGYSLRSNHPPSGDAFSVITKINKAENNIVKRLKFVIYLSFSNLGDTIDFEYPT